MSPYPVHNHANEILAHWPDGSAAKKAAEGIPERHRAQAQAMARRVWFNWNGRGPGQRWYFYEPWVWVRIHNR